MRKITKENHDILQEALYLLEPIPEGQFTKSSFTNGVDKCCAIGHVTRLKSNNPHNYHQDNCIDFGSGPSIRSASARAMDLLSGRRGSIVDINNESQNPKEAVIDFLRQSIEIPVQ